nr:hypothetical protein GTC16762_33620 [Pigmentibacter ruber]
MGTRITIESTGNTAIKELIDVLNGTTTPFKLPAMMNWPDKNKKRAHSERALRLMLAGLEAIKKDYPKETKQEINDIEETEPNQVSNNESIEGW